MITAVAFVCLAAAGAVGRAMVGHRFNVRDGFPLGTLMVNLAGSLALGVLHQTGTPAYTVFGIGMLGAFTTFSSFARDVVALGQARRRALLAIYVFLSMAAAVTAAAVGIALAP